MKEDLLKRVETAIGNFGVSATKISKITNIKIAEIKSALLFLIKENRIERHGIAKGTKYYLIGAQAALIEEIQQVSEEPNSDWKPSVGERVTIIYPPNWCVNVPPRRVGIVVEMQCEGSEDSFVILTNPEEYRMFIDPENCTKHGVKYRKWQNGDGWSNRGTFPKDKQESKKSSKKEKNKT